MANEAEINIFRSLDFIRDNATVYAKAKAQRVYLEEFRKSKKALIMKSVEPNYPAVAAQEREAYSHPEYMELLEALKTATEEEERLRWLIVAAQAKIECWRTLESTRRIEAKSI